MEAVDKTPLRVINPVKTNRLPADIEHHYRVELELAARLREAPRAALLDHRTAQAVWPIDTSRALRAQCAGSSGC